VPDQPKLHRACRVYGTGPDALISKFRFYELVKLGRVQLLHLGKSAYTRESAEEIIERIDAEDRAAGRPPKRQAEQPAI